MATLLIFRSRDNGAELFTLRVWHVAAFGFAFGLALGV